MFDESQHLVARTLDPTNSGVVWDKFYIYQGHRVNTPYIQIGTKRKNPPRLKLEKHPNAIRRALHYKELLDSGQVDSQGELSRLSGTPRTIPFINTIVRHEVRCSWWLKVPLGKCRPSTSHTESWAHVGNGMG